MADIVKKCITCGADGHTYFECARVEFGTLMAGAFGVRPIVGQTMEDAELELKKIAAERAAADRKE